MTEQKGRAGGQDARPLTALVGSGFIGPAHVEALRRLGRTVVGVLGSSPARSTEAARRLNIPRGYSSLEDLLADPEARVVHVTSPNRLHYEQCRQVLASGRHVVCEKPLAMTSAQTGELVRLADRSAGVSALCYNVRYYPLCQEARQRILAGELGEVHHVTGSYLQDWLLQETDFSWRVLPEEGGELRAVADIGTHWMDLILWLTCLEVGSLCADLHTVLPTRLRPRGAVETFQGKLGAGAAADRVPVTTEDYGSVLLRFRGGARGSYTVSQVAAGRKNCLRFEVSGSRGSLAWDSERPNELWIGHRERPNELLLRDPALLHPQARASTSYPGGHNEGYPDTFKQLFAAIYGYIEAGDPGAPRSFPTFADGHREALLCEAILTSQREQRWVDLPA